MNILLINGPNLNLLGKRETSLYGDISLSELENNLNSIAKDNGCMLKSIQSNAEHEIIESIHQAIDQNIKAIIIIPNLLICMKSFFDQFVFLQ